MASNNITHYYYYTVTCCPEMFAINALEEREIVYKVPFVEQPEVSVFDADKGEPASYIEISGDERGFTLRNVGEERKSYHFEAYGIVDERDLPPGTDTSALEPARAHKNLHLARTIIARTLIAVATVILLVALRVLEII